MRDKYVFLDKNDIEDFQNRCVVVIFLDNHPKIRFETYEGKNHFRGTIMIMFWRIYICLILLPVERVE